MQETRKHQRNARLPWGTRLIVYSYLDLQETAQKVAVLSSQERSKVLDSEIAREGKSLLLTIDLEGQVQGKFMSRKASQICLNI